MSEKKNIVVKMAKMVAEKSLRRDANRTTCNFGYQPKVPDGMDRFKKSIVAFRC